MKIINKKDLSDDDHKHSRTELLILKYLSSRRHPNVAALVDEFEDANYLVFVFDYFETDLYEFLKRTRISEQEAQVIFKQATSAVLHLHENHIAHCDIKPENILLNVKTRRVAITDFGFADFCGKRQLTRFCGSFGYIAPEVISHKPYAFSVDIWSLGVLAFVLLTQRLPFYDPDQGAELRNIKEGNYYYHPHEKVSDCAQSLIAQLLCVDVDKRPTIASVMKHPWVADGLENGRTHILT